MQFILILPFLPLSEGGDQQKRYSEKRSDQPSKPNISDITSETVFAKEIDLAFNASNSIHHQSRFEGFDYKVKGQGKRRKRNGNKQSHKITTRQPSRKRTNGADGKKLDKTNNTKNKMKWKRRKKNPKRGLIRKGLKKGKTDLLLCYCSVLIKM